MTENDLFRLSADRFEVNLTEGDNVVTFKVSSTLTVDSFMLFANGTNTGVELKDDGGFNYGTSKDDIPSDGVYTAQYTVSSDANADITFDARAVVGTNTVKTNEVVIFAYYELTDEQIALMDEVEAGISQVMKQADESLPEGASNDDRTQARFDAVMNYLQSKTEEGVIEALSGEREGGNISFSYTETGIGGGAMCDDSAFESGTEIKGSSEPRGTAPADIMTLSSDTTGINYISYHEKALVLHYYAENEGWSGQYLPTTNTLSDAGFDTTHRYSATINDYKSLKGYQFVMVDSHGSTYAHWFTTTPVICTNEGVTSDNQKSYSSDLFKNRIVKVGGKYWIRPDFFTFYYDQGHEMNCEIFHLAICKGAYGNTRLVDAINDAGANAVIAYTDTVTVGYDIAILQDALSTLLEGNSISNSLAYAKSQNGNQDPSTGAVPNYYGSGSAKIHSDLRNGNFDNVWDYLSDGISFWEEYGDARSIFKLSGIVPNSFPKMSIISSGFGSQNDETTSCIYQTILVPNDASTISFTYDVVSEEPMEYVGTRYNDTFDFEILDIDGNILETLASESVNGSMWYAVNGIDFPGGDDTTYHTRWQTVTSDAISKYRNELVVIRAIVRDAGDSIYDTAALVDSVAIN